MGNTNKASIMIFGGFALLGGVSCAIYGFVANRFHDWEIMMLIIGGGVAGFAVGLICNGIIAAIRK